MSMSDWNQPIKIEGVMTMGKSLMKTEDKSTLGSCVVGQQVHEVYQVMMNFGWQMSCGTMNELGDWSCVRNVRQDDE